MLPKQGPIDLSIIIPTYNESQNILSLIEAIRSNLPSNIITEIVIVDDNSPDGTGNVVEEYIQNLKTNFNVPDLESNSNADHSLVTDNRCFIRVIHRKNKSGLITAILKGVQESVGTYVLTMDADFSHPPQTIPKMIHELMQDPNCIVIASRYIKGASIIGWPYRRRLLSSSAVKIAQHSLDVRDVMDPISGFFALSRHTIENVKIDSIGYKILLEILVKVKGIKVKEIPYTFVDRRSGQSKLDLPVVTGYMKAVWYLYRYGQQAKSKEKTIHEKRRSVLFLSKAGRFYTVGASGLALNYYISFILSNVISNFWFIHATTIGIAFSVTSNFILNKVWTFEDRDFSPKSTLKQFGFFSIISTMGAALQLILLYFFVQSGLQFGLSLVIAVAVASVSNFLLNKKLTFHERIWG